MIRHIVIILCTATFLMGCDKKIEESSTVTPFGEPLPMPAEKTLDADDIIVARELFLGTQKVMDGVDSVQEDSKLSKSVAGNEIAATINERCVLKSSQIDKGNQSSLSEWFVDQVGFICPVNFRRENTGSFSGQQNFFSARGTTSTILKVNDPDVLDHTALREFIVGGTFAGEFSNPKTNQSRDRSRFEQSGKLVTEYATYNILVKGDHDTLYETNAGIVKGRSDSAIGIEIKDGWLVLRMNEVIVDNQLTITCSLNGLDVTDDQICAAEIFFNK